MTGRFLIPFALLISSRAFCQKYNFVNWTVEDGLIQSQASYICQDQYRQLWIGTEGGVCKFDGKKFTGYTVQEGLVSNPVNVLYRDVPGNIWIGTNDGLSVFNGRNFNTIKLGNSQNNITAIAENTSGTFVLNNYKLYQVRNSSARKISVSGDTSERITLLYQSPAGQLIAFVYGKGFYAGTGNSWYLKTAAGDMLKKKPVFAFFISSAGDTLFSCNAGLYAIENNKTVTYNKNNTNLNGVNIFCIAEDNRKNLWFGTEKGVYKSDGKQLIHFDAKNGFTDNSVNFIFNDAENNLWFATDADGIYKFRENTFTYYDKSSGLSNTIIMGVSQSSKGRIYAGGYGGGLYRIDADKNIQPVTNAPELANSKITCSYADDENNLWIGTLGKGIWKYNESGGLEKINPGNNPASNIAGASTFLKDKQGNMLIGGSQGLFIFDKNKNLTKVKPDNIPVTCLIAYSGDSMLVGTSKGIYTLNKSYNLRPIAVQALQNAAVLCLAKNGDNTWIGTMDKGVLNWNARTGKIVTYNTSGGLPSNFIYSIVVPEPQKAWIGTGFGISHIKVDRADQLMAIKNYGRTDGLLGMECSHNSLLKASDSSLWFGTTKGLFHFNPSGDATEKNQPIILLKSVKLFSSDIGDSNLYSGKTAWFNLPQDLRLKYYQNHLTFELGAIYFTNPEDVLYKYKLEGIDKNFTISGNPTIIYPALPPGQYTLQVQGITKNNTSSLNEVAYVFRIEKAFYQTRFFQIFVVLLLITSGALSAYTVTRSRQKRKQKAKETLEKIREEEFMKLRQRTAEDFHDEMGNSLTRISVLTDVLKSKLSKDETEMTKLLNQIRENTAALYNGTRDIIWSLNSQNDGMFEIAEHIKEIGAELFQETQIDFHYTHNIDPGDRHQLKLDYSRNLTMIFKEAYNNILKHARASKAMVALNLDANQQLEISIRDFGRGFDPQVSSGGNGIKNMANRVKRLNGEIQIKAIAEKGTEIKITLKNIFA